MFLYIQIYYDIKFKCPGINLVNWTPYFPTVLEAWAKRDHPNLLYLFYEDMKKVKINEFCFLFHVFFFIQQ